MREKKKKYHVVMAYCAKKCLILAFEIVNVRFYN